QPRPLSLHAALRRRAAGLGAAAVVAGVGDGAGPQGAAGEGVGAALGEAATAADAVGRALGEAGAAVGEKAGAAADAAGDVRSEEHTSELQSRENLVCRLLLEKKKKKTQYTRR